jgi:YVTN family beta-propeller protein
VGSELLSYRLEALLGRGGMGVVYRAYDTRLKRNVALKLVAPELSAAERLRVRFLSETEVAASLEHPHVVPIYDAGEVGGQLYLAMRYVEGSDLKTLLRVEGPLEPRRALMICAQIAGALDAAHERGLVHRDVKPSNVLLDGNEHVYLADFGLTRRIAERGIDGAHGLSLGTPAYAAPEQILGEDVDGRADLYSLACVLYECLAGEPPFARDSELAVLWAHLREEPPAPAAYPGLAPVLAKALARDRSDRYASCAELVEAARAALRLRDVVVVRERKPLLLLLTGVLVVAVALATALLLTRAHGHAGPDTRPTPLPKTDALQRIDPTSNRLVATFRLGSDPTGIAVGRGAIWVIQGDDNRISKIDPQTDAVVATSSTSGPLAVAVGDQAVWVVNGDGSVSQLDPVTVTHRHELSVPYGPELIAAGSDAVWTVSPTVGVLARINPLSANVIAKVPLAVEVGSPRAVAVGEDGVWVSSSDILAGDYRVMRIDQATNRVVATIRLERGAQGLAVGAGATWVANPLGGTVSQIDARTNRVVRRIRVGNDPIAVAVAEGSVWVTNYRDGTVSRIDPSRGRVVATIRVGPHPDHLAAGEGGVWTTVHVR